MSDPTTSPAPADWTTLFGSAEVAAIFQSEQHGLSGFWTALTQAAADSSDPALRSALSALAKVSSLFVRPDDWNMPYGPAIATENRRSPIPSDLTDEEQESLRSCAAYIPSALLKSRVYDVLSLLSVGRARVEMAVLHLDAILTVPISAESWGVEHDAWDRAILVARRYRQAGRSKLTRLEQELRRVVRTSTDPNLPLRAADLLSKHSLAGDRALLIARRMSRLAALAIADPDRYRAYLRASAEWYERGQEHNLSLQSAVLEIRSLIDEAESLARDNAMRAAHLFELALQRVRVISRAARVELGIVDLPTFIARRIRELGATSLGSMRAFDSEPIDLSAAARDARDRVKGHSNVDALFAMSTLFQLADYEQEVASATRMLAEHPLQSLFSTVHFSSDGRVVHRSGGQGETPIYGVDPALWRQMIQSYDLRIALYSKGVILPAWVQLTNEHQLALGDFASIVRGSGIVPADRSVQYARGLYYGYDGDFSTATQLLTPQFENLIRHHLANAGEATSTISLERTEMEIGTSALMERASVAAVFGDDLAFELRALLCGPIGPNLRNEVAHGLLSDSAASGANGVYLWWFALRLVFIPFWNELHDVGAAEGREPTSPRDPPEEE